MNAPPSFEQRNNNFDLIRLAAASQVLVLHSAEHLGVDLGATIVRWLAAFPGVPIFFVVSGFLISSSYRRCPSVGDYFRNRALRIFPGLWACFAFSVLGLAAVGELSGEGASTLLPWVLLNLGGLSFTPAFAKDFGIGAVNGSLWTIPVELQFYIVLPLLALVLGQRSARWLACFALSIALWQAYAWHQTPGDSGLWRQAVTRLLPTWLYLFLVGMYLEANRDLVQRYLAGKAVYWAAAYVVWSALAERMGLRVVGNLASPLVTVPLACLVISAAFTASNLADRLLHRNDISYGVYLYHMPVVNLSLEYGWRGQPKILWICALLTLLLAGLSWRFIERPALRRRRRP